jgi:multicomponent Na+:H+ antiporter subunit G
MSASLLGGILAILGALFLLLAALGLVRMPDLYSRMQAGTKATTLGTLLVAVGVALGMPGAWPKMVLLALFVLLTNPVSSHALSRSAHHQGVDPLDTEVKGRELTGTDALAEAKGASR